MIQISWMKLVRLVFFSIDSIRGRSRIFSREGGGFINKNSILLSTFFRSTKLILRALTNHQKNSTLTIFLAFSGILGNRVCSARAASYKIRKLLGSVSQNWISQNSSKG